MNKLKKILRGNKLLYSVAENIVDFYRWGKDNTVNRFLWYKYGKKPLNDNKIVICNYYGKGFSDNAKYIVSEIINRGLNYEIVWLVSNLNNTGDFPEGIRLVQYNSKEAIYEMATAKMWIDNSRKIYHTKKRKEQIYIQTWHGGIALKKIEKDAGDALFKSYIKFAKIDSKNADLFVSNSKFNTKLYRDAFWYDGEILESGVPRNDILFNNIEQVSKKVKDFFNIPVNKKIVMYAPTFRKDSNLDVYRFDYEKTLAELSRKFKDDYVMLIRLHPNILDRSTELGIEDKADVNNASFYPDMQELLVACDVLITDYSSSMFDFALTKKPCFIYASDIANYSDDRGFYFDLEKLPFVISRNTKEFLKNISEFDIDQYHKEVNSFLEEQGCVDNGNASKIVVGWIEENIDSNNNLR